MPTTATTNSTESASSADLSQRLNGRAHHQLRPHSCEPNFAPYAEGSVLIQTGNTRVLCAASVEEGTPSWMTDPGKGWVTAEYSMLPRSTHTRTKRENNRTAGRTQEIQRLIGRSLRSVVDLKAIGSRRITLDCDVLQADAGTRTASITGAWIALAMACHHLRQQGKLTSWPITDQVAAVSIGSWKDCVLLDLDYREDSAAEVDLNLVMTSKGQLVEVQGCGEEATFSRQQLNAMIDVGWEGLRGLFELQRQVLAKVGIEEYR